MKYSHHTEAYTEHDIPFHISKEIALQNLKRMISINIFSIFIFSSLFIINYYIHFIHIEDEENIFFYSLPYACAFILNISILTYFIVQNAKFGSLSDEDTEKIHILTICYVWAMLLISCSISIIDIFYYNHIIIFIVFLIICSSIIIIHIRYTIFIILLCASVLIWKIIDHDNLVMSAQVNIMLIVLLTVVTLILNYFNYSTIYNFLLQQQLFLKEKFHSKKLAEQLHIEAHTDELTRLANRRGYFHYIGQMKEHLPQRVTILILDIDSFKKYNDYYGHAYGDIVLAKVATSLLELCEPEDRFAVRWGGEEFLIILQNHSDEEILDFYHTFIHKMEAYDIRHALSPTSECVTYSVGGNSQIIHDLEDFNLCILHADQTQYVIKHSTKNAFALATDGEVQYVSENAEK